MLFLLVPLLVVLLIYTSLAIRMTVRLFRSFWESLESFDY